MIFHADKGKGFFIITTARYFYKEFKLTLSSGKLTTGFAFSGLIVRFSFFINFFFFI